MAKPVKPFNIHYDIDLVAQPTGTSCWSAAASMVLGSNKSVGPGNAALDASGGIVPTAVNIQAFAAQNGLIVEFGQTWTARGLAMMLRMYGPLWVGGKMPKGHAIVITGIEGTGDKDAVLTIYDPWPPGVGTIFPRVALVTLYTQFPEMTDYILHKPSAGQIVYPAQPAWIADTSR